MDLSMRVRRDYEHDDARGRGPFGPREHDVKVFAVPLPADFTGKAIMTPQNSHSDYKWIMMREQERRELHHLVSSSVPSPPFSGLSLLNPTALVFAQDPRVISAHLLARYAATNPDSRFQLPLALPAFQTVPTSNGSPMYHVPSPGQVTPIKKEIIQTDKPSRMKRGNTKLNGKIKLEQMEESTKTINNNNNMNISNNNTNHKNNKGTTQQPQSNQQSRDKVFTCNICSRVFGYKHVLQNHERTHTGEKPFECNICSKKFTRDHHLKTHMRLHTGEKPYQCSHCDRQFVQVANLRRHLRVHTGERPYSCELCAARFSDSNQLKAHSLIHKGEKPYSCPDCGGRFRRRHHLLHHKCNSKEKSPTGSLPELSPISNKRERKSRETRRIIRMDDMPVSTVNNGSPMDFLPVVVPEQTVPEDLSITGSLSGSHRYSGSNSSCSASPSPASGDSHTSGRYCHSITSGSDLHGYSSEEDVSSTRTGKTESSPMEL